MSSVYKQFMSFTIVFLILIQQWISQVYSQTIPALITLPSISQPYIFTAINLTCSSNKDQFTVAVNSIYGRALNNTVTTLVNANAPKGKLFKGVRFVMTTDANCTSFTTDYTARLSSTRTLRQNGPTTSRCIDNIASNNTLELNGAESFTMTFRNINTTTACVVTAHYDFDIIDAPAALLEDIVLVDPNVDVSNPNNPSGNNGNSNTRPTTTSAAVRATSTAIANANSQAAGVSASGRGPSFEVTASKSHATSLMNPSTPYYLMTTLILMISIVLIQ